MEVAESIQRGEVVRLVLDDLALFFYRRRNFTHFQVLLGCAQSLYLFQRHEFFENRGMNLR